MIRVLVVDDHTLVRDGLCRLLDSEADITVAGHTGSGREAVRMCDELQPDVVLLDYNLPDVDGLGTTEAIGALGNESRVLILTMYASEEYAIRLMRAGAAGFIVKGESTDELLKAVRVVAGKGTYVAPAIQEKMVGRISKSQADTPEAALSNREMQVLVRLARGSTSREVAGDLCVSLSTVETHRSRILDKLGLRNNADMTRFAVRRRLIDPE